MIFSSSCKTTEIKYHVPDIDFPDFPVLGDYEIMDNGNVSTSAEYFRRLLIFRTQYNELILEYNEKKQTLNEGEK